ncbi:MAG TPA: ECF-type sigma factor [Phycisphaerales bacterium]|nr:ECF-type sigma factor [Phycisphaerales bacterium]
MKRAAPQDIEAPAAGPGGEDDRGPSLVLRAASAASTQAAADLLPLVYRELRVLARSRIAKLPPGQTLQATALVHEAYMRIVGSADPGWSGRAHFFAAAARAMRNILVDLARSKGAGKRGGGRRRVVLDGSAGVGTGWETDPDYEALDRALSELERLDARKSDVVMLRFFGGMTTAQTAAVLGVSSPTVERDWAFAKAWLRRRLDEAPECGPDERDGSPGR